MNPQVPYQPQQPQQPAPSEGGMPPVAPVGWQQPSNVPPATTAAQAQPAPAEFSPAPGVAESNYSIDYLNQIAPKEQKTVNRFAVIALIAGVLISALFGMILLSNSGGPSANEQLTPLSLRIATLKSVTASQQKHLNENQINEANAALNSSLTTMNTDIEALMKERKLKTSEKSAAAKTEKAYSDELAKTLDDSYQRGTLDRTYTSQMTYELTVLKSKLTKLQRSTKSKELTEFATSASENIDTVLKAYASFEATKS
ncbi:MAG: hypothetical protein ACM3KF_04265 [Acidobacteriota bacterium]